MQFTLALNSANYIVITIPRKLKELLKDYINGGGTVDMSKGKGSHRKVKHPSLPRPITVSGKANADALPYQEKDLKKFLKNK